MLYTLFNMFWETPTSRGVVCSVLMLSDEPHQGARLRFKPGTFYLAADRQADRLAKSTPLT